MEYTNQEKEFLSVMGRTDFKNLSKNDVIGFASKLGDLRPEVATQVLAQFPELAKMIRETMTDYKCILENIINSDDQSINHGTVISCCRYAYAGAGRWNEVLTYGSKNQQGDT